MPFNEGRKHVTWRLWGRKTEGLTSVKNVSCKEELSSRDCTLEGISLSGKSYMLSASGVWVRNLRKDFLSDRHREVSGGVKHINSF